jgi:hypothetical protein
MIRRSSDSEEMASVLNKEAVDIASQTSGGRGDGYWNRLDAASKGKHRTPMLELAIGLYQEQTRTGLLCAVQMTDVLVIVFAIELAK